MKRLIFCIALFLVELMAYAQSADWNFLVPPKGDVNLFSMNWVKHKGGYTFIGAFSTQLELNQQIITNSNGWGLFLAKYDLNGAPISLSNIGHADLTTFGNSNFRFGLCVDTLDNTYFALSFKDSILVQNQMEYGNNFFNALTCKLDSQGNLVWREKIAGVGGASVGYNQCLQINLDQSISLCVGVSDSTLIDTFWIQKGRGLFVNLDTNGQVNWIKKAGRDNVIGGYFGLNDKLSDNHYLIGVFETVNNIQFDNISVMASNEYGSTTFNFISKYNLQGQIQWVRHFGGATFNARFNPNIIKTDSKGNVYVSGSFRCQGSFDQVKVQGGGLYNGFGNDVFVLKYDKDGNFKWFKHTTITDEEEWRGFDISDHDELYLTYAYNTMSKFETDSVQSVGGRDIALVKLDTLGNVVWMNSIGGSGGEEVVSLLCSDTTFYLLGQSTSTPCHFNQTDHTTQVPGNLFLARLNKYELWPVGLQEPQWQSISIYPNPSNGTSTLSLPNATQGTYTLYDMAGRDLLHQNLNPSQTLYTISTSSLSSGIYLLKLYTPQGNRSEKLVVE